MGLAGGLDDSLGPEEGAIRVTTDIFLGTAPSVDVSKLPSAGPAEMVAAYERERGE